MTWTLFSLVKRNQIILCFWYNIFHVKYIPKGILEEEQEKKKKAKSKIVNTSYRQGEKMQSKKKLYVNDIGFQFHVTEKTFTPRKNNTK